MLYAEIRRLQHYFRTVKLVAVESRQHSNMHVGEQRKKQIVNEVLDHLGFFRMLNCPKRFPSTRTDVVTWGVIQYNKVDMEKAIPLLDTIGQLISAQSSEQLAAGLGEVVDNAVDHAYSDIRPDGLNIDDNRFDNRNWYLLTSFREESVSVILADLGVGIPTTLPNSNPEWLKVWERLNLRPAANFKADGNAIKFAFKHGKSRTGKPNRGTGLPHLVQTIEKISGVHLTILSNHGAYTFDRGGWQVQPDSVTSIYGTLISWNLPIQRHLPSLT